MKIIKQSAHIVKDWAKMDLYQRCEFAGRISRGPLSERQIKEGSAEEFVRRMVKLGHESVFEFARIIYPIGVIEEDGYERCKWFSTNMRTIREQARLLDNRVEISPQMRELVRTLANDLSGKGVPAFFDDFDYEESPVFRLPNPIVDWYPMGVTNLYLKKEWIPVIIITNRAISHQLVRYRKEVVYLQASQRFIKFHDDIEFISPDVYFDMDDKMYRQWIESMEGAEQDYIHCLSEGYSAQAARLFLPNSAATKLIMYASPDTWRHVFEQRISDNADPMIRELLEPLKEEFEKENLL